MRFSINKLSSVACHISLYVLQAVAGVDPSVMNALAVRFVDELVVLRSVVSDDGDTSSSTMQKTKIRGNFFDPVNEMS